MAQTMAILLLWISITYRKWISYRTDGSRTKTKWFIVLHTTTTTTTMVQLLLLSLIDGLLLVIPLVCHFYIEKNIIIIIIVSDDNSTNKTRFVHLALFIFSIFVLPAKAIVWKCVWEIQMADWCRMNAKIQLIQVIKLFKSATTCQRNCF